MTDELLQDGPMPRLTHTPLVHGALAKPFGAKTQEVLAELDLPGPDQHREGAAR